MEKIFKKSLALVLSAALCLTALVGCLTVSAEGTTAKPTYALDAVKGKPGDAVIVTATLSNLNKVTAQHIKVTFPAGLEIGNITDGNGGVYTRLTETTDVDDPNLVGLYSKTTTADNGTLIQFVDFVNWPNADGTYTNVVESLVVKFAVTISTEAVAGHVYDITAAVDAADYDADKLMDVALTPGKITVTTAAPAEPEILSFQIKNPAILIKEKYGFRFRIDFADIKTVTYDHYDILFETQKYEGTTYVLSDYEEIFDSTKRDASSNTNTDFYFYSDVAAYALNVPITLTARFYDSNNVLIAKSTPRVFDIASLAKAKLADAKTGSLLKTMYIDMLNYGTEAQKYFAQYSTDLTNAIAINADCEAYQELATAEVPSLDAISKPDTGSSGITCTPGLQVAASNNLYYRFTIPSSLNVSNLKLKLTHVSIYGEVTNTYEISSLDIDSRGRYTLGYSKIYLFDTGAPVTAEIINSDQTVIYSMKYNIYQYISEKNRLSNDFYASLAKFSTSTRLYFESL